MRNVYVINHLANLHNKVHVTGCTSKEKVFLFHLKTFLKIEEKYTHLNLYMFAEINLVNCTEYKCFIKKLSNYV